MSQLYHTKPSPFVPAPSRTGSLLAFFFILFVSNIAFAQNVTIKGKIKDDFTGEGLPGANVVVKGTTNGTTSDLNGDFTIMAPENVTLVISFVGFKTQEVLISSRSVIEINLEGDAETLSEIVVVGYGTIEKKDATGSLANVNTKQFNKGLITSPEQLIVGKVAGLQINQSGEPGGGAGIRLRGVSINGETPLYVVDGVVLAEGGGGVTGGRSPLNFINPSDISSFSVLKDAQATAIYGARGANGVIIITTKSGVVGKPTISYDGSYSLSLFTRKPDILSASEFRQIIAAKAPQAIGDLGTANTDWLDEVTRLGQSMQHTIALSGGVKKTTYYASLNYLQTQGVLRFSDHSRVNLSLKIEQKLLKDKLKLTLSTKNGFTNDQFGPNVLGGASAFDPTQPVYDPTNVASGGYFQWPNTIVTSNPVATQEQATDKGNTFRNVSNLAIRYEIPFINGLSFNANLAYDLMAQKSIEETL
jgi:TonB-dependent starch-binding outer membrane protein SusC